MRRRAERGAARLAAALGGRTYIGLEFPPAATSEPRWGRGRPPHAALATLLASHRDRYHAALAEIERHGAELDAISRNPPGAQEPHWLNPQLPGIDAAAIYAFIRERRPARYVEVGSGNSTLFAARAKRDGGLGTRIESIDPQPRREIDDLCDEVVRAPFESTDPARFSTLEPGDIVFFDSSHRTYMNSDVTAFFLDVLPGLPPGVLVGVHDIFLPDDYPAEWAEHWFTEQYLLAAWLLAGGGRTTPVLASHFLAIDDELRPEFEAAWRRMGLGDVNPYGMAFWMLVG